MDRSEYLRNYYKDNKKRMNDRRLENYYHLKYGTTCSDQIKELQKKKQITRALHKCSPELIEQIRETLAKGNAITNS